MLIRAEPVDGLKPNDLHSINGLNHYIGMRPIEPSAIPELRYMPWIVAGLDRRRVWSRSSGAGDCSSRGW